MHDQTPTGSLSKSCETGGEVEDLQPLKINQGKSRYVETSVCPRLCTYNVV